MIIVGRGHLVVNGAGLWGGHEGLVVPVARSWRARRRDGPLVGRRPQTHRGDVWNGHLSLAVKNMFERV